ncbi:MAG: ferrous iron transport protein B, partial [Ruminiclostridium sp.]|nr:ferrous iron transport protein B [Ruminiclostridium sp.]
MEKEASKEKEIVVAIAGNPNCGKTVIFNSLTGARQHVGNWPGVTVEKKEGSFVYNGKQVKVVDLPGTYSLGAYSEDEAVARDYILFEKPDVVVNVIDSTNMERSMYLTGQLLEMGVKVIIALNMYDEARSRNIEIDMKKMSLLLGVPVLPTVATKNQGITELERQMLETSSKPAAETSDINYGNDVEEVLKWLQNGFKKDAALSDYNPRSLAVKFLEGDTAIEGILKNSPGYAALKDYRDNWVKKLESMWGDDIEAFFTEKRYGFISGIIKETLKKYISAEEKQSISDKIDKVVTNRFLGIPIFLFAMWGVFQFTFTLGTPIADLIDSSFGWLGSLIKGLLEAAGAPELLNSLIVSGIIGGVGSVIVFMPNIFLLFFAISLLEDSGYMARAAYITDRFMHTLGLHGKSFIPMIVGFGCNVPGILATRTLDNKRDRLVTILINPLMSCSARLPVYILFTGAFFSVQQGLIIFSLYLLGIVLAILMGVIF